MPTDLSRHFLYYRQDLIDTLLADDAAQAKYAESAREHLGEALGPKAPDTWTRKDFVANAPDFRQSLNPDSPTRYDTVIQAKSLAFDMMVFQSWPRKCGGDWMGDAGNVTVDSEAYRTALAAVRMLIDLGATPPDSTSCENAGANAACSWGQVAAMVPWNAAASELAGESTGY